MMNEESKWSYIMSFMKMDWWIDHSSHTLEAYPNENHDLRSSSQSGPASALYIQRYALSTPPLKEEDAVVFHGLCHIAVKVGILRIRTSYEDR